MTSSEHTSTIDLLHKTVSGMKLLNQSHSVLPRILAHRPDEVELMKSGQIKDLYLQVVDFEKKKGITTIEEERGIDRYLTGTAYTEMDDGPDLDEELYLEHAKDYIRQKLLYEEKQYDRKTGLAFYNDEMRKRIVRSLLRRYSSQSDSSHFSVIICDVNKLHEVNQEYGPDQGDRLLATIGEGLLNSIGPIEFELDTEIYLAREYGTGDSFVVVVIGDEKGSQAVLENIEKYQFPVLTAGVLKTGKMSDIKPSLRNHSLSSNEMEEDLDPGDMLDRMIKTCQTIVDQGGSKRAAE